MRENRPLAFGGVLVFGSGFCLVFFVWFWRTLESLLHLVELEGQDDEPTFCAG